MIEKIEKKMAEIQEQYKSMSENLRQVEAQREQIAAEMLRLDGAFRELKSLLDAKEDN